MCELNKPTLLFTQSKSDMKWLRYDQNRNSILRHGNSGGWLVDLVWLNKTSIPNFSFLDKLEVAQIYFPRGWVGVIIRIKNNKLGLNLAKLRPNWNWALLIKI